MFLCYAFTICIIHALVDTRVIHLLQPHLKAIRCSSILIAVKDLTTVANGESTTLYYKSTELSKMTIYRTDYEEINLDKKHFV